jgi:hypothetical protein
MKVKVSQVIAVVEVLKKFGSIDGLTAKQAYHAAKMLRKCQGVFEDFEKGRIAAAAKHGDKKGNNYEVQPDNIEKFNVEIGELLNEEVDLGVDMVEISGDIKGLTPHDFNALEPFVTVKE